MSNFESISNVAHTDLTGQHYYSVPSYFAMNFNKASMWASKRRGTDVLSPSSASRDCLEL